MKQKWDIRNAKNKDSDYMEIIKADMNSTWAEPAFFLFHEITNSWYIDKAIADAVGAESAS